MPTVVSAEGVILQRLLEGGLRIPGLSRKAWEQFDAAQRKTVWGRDRRRRMALVDGDNVLASATQYDIQGVLDGQPVRVCALGEIFTHPKHRSDRVAQELVNHLFDDASRYGAAIGLVVSDMGQGIELDGFEAIPITETEITVIESARYGAPMTPIRGGEGRDLAAIASMGRIRAEPFRFHLGRDADFVQYAITRKRLLAGLGAPGARQLHFFIAEEGITAAAYVVITVTGRTWTIEECGDRDPTGARVGAILQALIAREPVEHRPTIRGWLPRDFAPPQVSIASTTPSTEVLMVRSLGSTVVHPRLSGDDVLYWRSDIF